MSPKRGVKRRKRKRFNDLFEKGLPRSANAICSNSMVNDLADIPKKRLREYIVERCPGSPEIADALFWVAETHPNQLRTKELCETLEAVTLIGADINALLANSRGNAPGGDAAGTRRKGSMTIYDLACGHGLAGTLLAYRFPEVRVVCVDLERRPCWSTYREAFERFGDAVDGADAVTANLAFAEGDITNNEEASFRPKGGDYLVCLHGCNDLSPSVLEMAAEHRAGFAVMPCCLREGMLGVSTASSNRNWGIADDTARYALQVGYLAGKFGCAKVASISQFITNRFLIIMGDWPSDRPSSEDGSNNEDQRQ